MRVVTARCPHDDQGRQTTSGIPLSDGTRLVRADLAAAGVRRATPCPRSSSTSRTASGTSPRCATRSTTPTSPDTATPACGSTCAAAATPRACSPTSTSSRSSPTPRRCWPGSPTQPWCDGRTGMMGISWGGFAALQVAARRPPSLRRHRHRVVHRRPVRRRHALHGRLPARPTTSPRPARCSPTTPARRTRRWSASAGARCGTSGCDDSRPWVVEWLRHQRRDDYWRHALGLRGLLRDPACPVLAVQRLGRRLLQRGAAGCSPTSTSPARA